MELSYSPLPDDVSRRVQDVCVEAMPAGEVVVSPPRSGSYQELQELCTESGRSTWTQEMVWLLKNDIDFEKAKSKYLYTRFPFLEYKALNAEGNSVPDTIHNVEIMAYPRLIKTRLPVQLLPRQVWTKKPKSQQPLEVSNLFKVKVEVNDLFKVKVEVNDNSRAGYFPLRNFPTSGIFFLREFSI
ncbi:hypothetical protein J6590_000034 [Homalodisca vitripennis]|nr:hypothetical protein J6590_000034 [Homalodisca vitripennis]